MKGPVHLVITINDKGGAPVSEGQGAYPMFCPERGGVTSAILENKDQSELGVTNILENQDQAELGVTPAILGDQAELRSRLELSFR